MGKYKLEQGQGEDFIAMLNPTGWSKGNGVDIVMDIPFNCCKPWFELHVLEIAIAGTS